MVQGESTRGWRMKRRSNWMAVQIAIAAAAASTGWLTLPAAAQRWPGYAHDPQHTCLSARPAQAPERLRWSTPVDLAPQYSGADLLIHYGSPVITDVNTILVPVKTAADGGFRVDA